MRGEVVGVVDPQAREVIEKVAIGGGLEIIRKVEVVLPGSSSRSCMFLHAFVLMRRVRKLRGSCLGDCVEINR